ncbi:MAG: hypothetical protein OXH96_09820 [Spirochaetaceae bacterium]|nr:hypothetical protein [Spirochaetaceae bacterium]
MGNANGCRGLSAEQVDRFQRDGYVRLGRAFAIHFMTPGTKSRRTGDYLPVSFARPLLRMRV